MAKPREAQRTGGERSERAVGVPTRTCAGCGADDAARSLVRVVLVTPPDGGPASVVVDAKGGAFGRGAHVHPTLKCLEGATRRGFARAFKREVRIELATLLAGIVEAYTKRLDGLLAGGVRGGHVILGTDDVVEAWHGGHVQLMVLAADAAAAANVGVVRHATGEGKVLVYGDKLRLARTLGRRPGEEREGIGVCAIMDAGLAAAIREAWLCAVGLARGEARQQAAAPSATAGNPPTEIQDAGAGGDARGVEA